MTIQKVLLIEPDVFQQEILGRRLGDFQIEIQACRTGREAMRILSSGPIICSVVMEIDLPDIFGLELARRIRLLPPYSSLPIFAFTHHSGRLIFEQGLTLPLSGYFLKTESGYREIADSIIRHWRQPQYILNN